MCTKIEIDGGVLILQNTIIYISDDECNEFDDSEQHQNECTIN